MSYPNPEDMKINHNRCVEVDYFVYIEMYTAAEAYEKQHESERRLRKLCGDLCEKMQDGEYVDIPSATLHTLLSELDLATKSLERLCGK